MAHSLRYLQSLEQSLAIARADAATRDGDNAALRSSIAAVEQRKHEIAAELQKVRYSIS